MNLTPQQKANLLDALKIVERTARGWQHTLQMDLTPLYPVEQESILYQSQLNYLGATCQVMNVIAQSFNNTPEETANDPTTTA